jgi:DNA-directed RNA polymerase specialized sigma24 family protein
MVAATYLAGEAGFFRRRRQKYLLTPAFIEADKRRQESDLVVDYEKLIGKLTERACHVLGVMRFSAPIYVVDGLGKSPDDFAFDVLNLYLTEQVNFPGDDEDGLFRFLAEVMGNDILDELRSSGRKTTQKVPHLSRDGQDDSQAPKGLDDFDSGFSVDELIEGNLLKERLYSMLEKSDPELYEVVYAVFELGALTPREIAELVRTTPSEIQNRKKRLRTFLAKHDLAAAEKGKSA